MTGSAFQSPSGSRQPRRLGAVLLLSVLLALIATAIWERRLIAGLVKQSKEAAETNEQLQQELARQQDLRQRLGARRRTLEELENLRKAVSELPRLQQNADRLGQLLASALTNSAPDGGALGQNGARNDKMVLSKQTWADRGYNTPEASLETVAWAMRDGLIDRIRQVITLPSSEVDPGAFFPPGRLEELKQAFEAAVTNGAQAVAQSEEIRIRDIRQESTNRATVFIAQTLDQSGAEGATGPGRIIRPVEFRRVNGEWKLYLDSTNRWPLRQY